MELNLVEVRSFTVLVRECHYGRAAAHLHVSTSCLSKRIQRLECQLGMSLVDRGPGGVVSITGSGRLFAIRAELLLDFAQQLVGSAHEVAAPVVVGVPGADGARVIEAWVQKQSRMVRETLRSLVRWLGVEFDQLDSALPERRVDVMLTAGPSSLPLVTSTRLWPMTRVGLVARSHPLGGRRTIPVEEFAALPVLRSAAAPPDWMSLWCLGDVRPLDEARLVELVPRAVSDVLDGVVQGRAVAVSQRLLSTALPPTLRSVELVGVPPAWYYAHTRHDERKQVVAEVVRVLKGIQSPALQPASIPTP